MHTSLQALGDQFKNYMYALPVPLNFRNYNIAHLEMVNVVVALKIWGNLWANKRKEFFVTIGQLWMSSPRVGLETKVWSFVPGMSGCYQLCICYPDGVMYLRIIQNFIS